jgi:hypothetical protein
METTFTRNVPLLRFALAIRDTQPCDRKSQTCFQRIIELKKGSNIVVVIIVVVVVVVVVVVFVVVLVLVAALVISSVTYFMLHPKQIDIRSSNYLSPIPYLFILFLHLVLPQIFLESIFMYATKRNNLYLVYSFNNGIQWLTVPIIYVIISCLFGCRGFTGGKM